MIHADFVLTANREDIQGDLQWNKVLQYQLSTALCLTFEWLATSADSNMRYCWPEYLDCLWNIHDPFLKVVADTALAGLRLKPLIEPEILPHPFLAPPASWTIPAEFREASAGLPITSGKRLARSNAYSNNSPSAL